MFGLNGIKFCNMPGGGGGEPPLENEKGVKTPAKKDSEQHNTDK
ncbi:hypothetical protein NFHSH190041_37240 (plasmid) [Shewanella sp. NFH-SH190041]|nr:hypothetical protein [Shewanella sp. NFH-SH190041]BDM66272.1 hypothetical protein NFHSH190041_37240 [Shewanella sp. NFH-SH190041]